MSRSQRILTILLVCSLAVNLLLIGGIVGRFAFDKRPTRPLPDHAGWIIRQLDEDRRQELRDELAPDFRSMRDLRRSLRKSQADFEAAITAGDFDRERTARALAELRQSQLAWQSASHDQMVELLSRLTPEERARAAAFLNRAGGRRFERHGDRPPPP